MQVLVDTCERNWELIETLESFPDVELSFQRLPVGDYQWPGDLIFERKTLQDLLKSLVNGRLFRQAHRLRRRADPGVLILEGTLRSLISRDGTSRLVPWSSGVPPAKANRIVPATDSYDSVAPHARVSPSVSAGTAELQTRPLSCKERRKGFQRAVVQGVLIHLTVNLGIPILRSTGPAETAWLMRATACQLSPNRPPRRHPFKAPVATRSRSLERQRLQLLQQLPGVGPERAASLLARFGTPAAVLGAGVKELCDVKGIGKGIASQIHRVTAGKE